MAKFWIRTVIHLLGNTEIGDLDTALVVHQDIGALDIAVNDVALMEVVETLENLSDKVPDECLFEGAVVR
jgi:hypothetical protein